MTLRKWDRKQTLAEARFAWIWLFLSAFLGATLSIMLFLVGLPDRISFSVPLLLTSLLLVSVHVFRFWQHNRAANRTRFPTTPSQIQLTLRLGWFPVVEVKDRSARLSRISLRRHGLIGILAILGLVGLLILMGLAVNLLAYLMMPR